MKHSFILLTLIVISLQSAFAQININFPGIAIVLLGGEVLKSRNVSL